MPWGWSSQASSNGAYTLWIKSLKRYDVSEVNLLSTVNPGVGIFFVWFYSFLSDALQTKMPIIVVQCLFQFGMQFAFVFWKSSFNFKWAAVATGYAQVALSPIVYSWANEICREDAEERAFVIASMLAISNSFSAWLVILQSKLYCALSGRLTGLGSRCLCGLLRVLLTIIRDMCSRK